MKSNPAKKTSEQCFSGETKPTCQNSASVKHFQKWPKNLGDVLSHSLSFEVLIHRFAFVTLIISLFMLSKIAC